MKRRLLFTRLGLACAAALGVCAAATAATFPDKPLTLVVGFAPGGAGDTVARQLAEDMGKALGQRVNVENKSGASGNIGTQTVLNAPADGYTLLFAAIHLATNPWLSGVKYDPVADLTMVSQITSVPVVMLTHAERPFQQPVDVVLASHRTPGGLKVGSGGIGTSSHLAMELFSRSRNVPFVHVPYRGGAPANQALMSGEIDLMFDLMSGTLKGMVDSGKLRALAVMQDRRVASLPDVKSAAELGLPPETHIRTWQGVAVKSGTPPDVVQKLHKAVLAATRSPGFIAAVDRLGFTMAGSATPEAFQKFYLAEYERWGRLIKAANIKAE